jgi:hypothetical protein
MPNGWVCTKCLKRVCGDLNCSCHSTP